MASYEQIILLPHHSFRAAHPLSRFPGTFQLHAILNQWNGKSELSAKEMRLEQRCEKPNPFLNRLVEAAFMCVCAHVYTYARTKSQEHAWLLVAHTDTDGSTTSERG